jgi:FkbM family methyltransferase
VKKVLFIVPHLSTGGLPQYTLSLIKKIINDVDVYCIEYSMIADIFVVQRKQIVNLLGDKFYSLRKEKNELLEIVRKINPDIIHLQEIPELFMQVDIALALYASDRTHTIIETSHDSSFNIRNKKFFPDKFALISEYQRREFSKLKIPTSIIEYDIEYKDRLDRELGLKKLGLDPNLKHILNVGLFTPRKNQSEIFDYAREMIEYPIQFHFVGNQADNFKDYWEPLIKDCPPNVKIWGERSDVDNFYSCMDLFLFTSRGKDGDKETSPLVIRESISYHMPSLIYNLPVYLDMYDKYENVSYLNFDNLNENKRLIREKLNLLDEKNYLHPFETLNGVVDLSSIQYPKTMYDAMIQHGEAAAMWWGAFIHKELDREDVKIEDGDIFVDLGANIGVSSYYALKNGAKKVYCFEPDKQVLSLLEKNIKRNKKTFNYAVSHERKSIELYHWPYNSYNDGPKYTVDCITLDDVIDLVNEPLIDYLKIDIEGFEENIFDSVSIENMKRIKKMFIEYHNPEKTDEFVKKIKKLGFNVRVEYGNGQNYLYCYRNYVNTMIKKIAQISYDKNDNKIEYVFDDDQSNILISIRDIDSNVVIWSVKSDNSQKNIRYWIKPIPKEFYDFESESNFGGLSVEIYSNDNLVQVEKFRIKWPNVNKPISKIANNTEPTFINYNEFFVDKIYNEFVEGNEYKTVVDVGANVGLWIEYIKHFANVKNVYAIEPNKNAVKILKDTFGSSVNVIDKALHVLNEKLKFYTDENNSTISSISNHSNFNSSYEVDGITIKQFVKENNITKIDLLKVDIESAEYDLFSWFDKNDFDMIDNILVEYHLLGSKTMDDAKLLEELLKDNGFNTEFRSMNPVGGFIFASKSKKPNLEQLKLW